MVNKNRKKQLRLIFWWMSCLLIVLDAAFVAVNYSNAKNALHYSLERQAKTHMQAIDLSLSMTLRNMLQLATHISYDTSLNQLFLAGKQAVSQHGLNSIEVANIREKILAKIKPGWDEMTSEFDVRQLHYHLGPGSLSFLRVHKPKKFGDRMDEIRYTIVDTNAEKISRVGFETGRVYSGLRGVVPIWAREPETQQRLYVGALEVGTSYSSILKNLDAVQGVGSTILLNKAHAERNMWPQSIQQRFGDELQSCECYIESTSRSLTETKSMIAAIQNFSHFDANKTQMHLIKQGQQHYSIYHQPLRDYRGKLNPELPNAGSTLIWNNITKEVNKFHQDIQLNIVYALIGFMIIEFALFFAIRFERKYHEIESLVGLDTLTAIPNRHDFEIRLKDEVNRAKRHNKTLSIVMADIDYFKPFNDTYGHVQGDICLQKVAQALSGSLQRAGDYIARYGGEEFILILPETSLEQAGYLIEKSRLAVENLAVEHKGSKVSNVVTVSFGLVNITHLKKETTYTDLVKVADSCLYQAKEQGRNCIVSRIL